LGVFIEGRKTGGLWHKGLFSTENPSPYVGRILVRLSHDGHSVPSEAIPDSYEEAMKNLPNARRHADDLLVYGNTPNDRGISARGTFHCGRVGQGNEYVS